jgi:asparagine synthase (glutamine-hydrolysing)
MIYAGFIRFNEASDKIHELCSVLESYTQTPPIVVNRDSLSLCYGKVSDMHDMDELWENKSSVLMGRIFDKEKGGSFGKKEFENLSSSNKEEALKKIWGKYVYIQTNEKSSQYEIVNDLTGQLPFFYYPFPDGNVLFSSDIEIIFKVLSQKPEYNWSYLYSYLIYGSSSAIQTPFKKVYELPPACCLKITKNERHTKPFWNPLDSYNPSVSQKRSAVDVLEATLKPWIEPYQNICVSLSGGLDSSSLVYCLKNIKKKDQTLSALNYFHASVKSSNELLHARKVCEETGIDLIECEASHTLSFDPPSQNQPLKPNKPLPGFISLKWLETISDHIPSDGSCVFFCGHGSDHIFMRPPSKQSVSDYVLEKGLKGSKEQLKNITQYYRDPLFSVLKDNAMSLSSYFCSRRLAKRHPKNIQDETPDWIKQEARHKTSSDFVHPIYGYLPMSVLPGKYEQIDALYEGLASIHMEMNPLNPTSYPYLYEPVVEFALSFPTYDLFDKGYDRYPLRKAVSDHFKTETVWRRDKSETTGILQLGIKKNLEYVLELCLEGQFAQQGLIDKKGLHQTILRIGHGEIQHLWPFIQLASAEIFLRYWEEKTYGHNL